MCGIAAYVGRRPCRQFILEGLERLEYRGYDSAGFVCVDAHHKHLSFSKAEGRLDFLKTKLSDDPHDGFVGMGHTRWATHGVADEVNAHPHFDCTKRIALVHNGIIEGYQAIKERLKADGHEFFSDTDTETVAHLFEWIVKQRGDDNLVAALIELVGMLRGAYSLLFLMEDHPNQLIVVRHHSPVAVGFGDDEMFVGSDALVFSDKTKKVLFLPDDSFAFITREGVELYRFSGEHIKPMLTTIDTHYNYTSKDGFEHYMLKEIYEQKRAIDRTVRFYSALNYPDEMHDENRVLKSLGLTCSDMRGLKSISIIAAGTSWHASRIAQFFFEEVCGIPVRVFLASEFCYMPFFPNDDTLYIAVSQSGETADTLQALRRIHRESAAPTLALTNVASSTMVREAKGFLLMQAGPEISVCSTKAFSGQLASLYWFSHLCAYGRGAISQEQLSQAEVDLFVTAEILESLIETYKEEVIHTLAPRYARYDRFIFLGRHSSYPFAMEAALKLKEISYIFAQCYPSGELKHGPIALVDDKTPVVLFSSLEDVIYQKTISNAQEVKARAGHLLVFAFEGQDELIELADYAFVVPRVTPLLGALAMSGIMQFFVYHITRQLGLPIDKPRNLAKSVTVE